MHKNAKKHENIGFKGVFGAECAEKKNFDPLSTIYNGIFRPEGGGSIAGFWPEGGGRLQSFRRTSDWCMLDSNYHFILHF